MGFFSPGFIIGAATGFTNQIEAAKERNAEMMERRRDQFDRVSNEARRELDRKRMTEQEYVALANEVLSPEIKNQIGDDPALMAAAGKSFKIQSQSRGITPGNYNKSLLLSGMDEEGKFNPSKAFSITEVPKMSVEKQTDEGFFGRISRGITGAPSQQELAETDTSKIPTDIREASVNLTRIYNPVSPDSREWSTYEKLFAESEGLKASINPFDRTVDRVETFKKAEDDVKQKYNILNELRMGQTYTEEDLPGILNDIKIIYDKTKKLPKDQADAAVAKIVSDMNRTSVSEVMKTLTQNASNIEPEQPPKGAAPAPKGSPAPTESGIDEGLRQAFGKQVESGADNIQVDPHKPPVYEIEYNGEIYTIEQSKPGQQRILGRRPITEIEG
jgi:hypothetical protein